MTMRPAKNRIAFILLVSTVSFCAGAAPSSASQGDTLCIHFTGAPKGMHIQLIGDIAINGTLPLTLCNLERGRIYDLIAGGRELEQRRGYFSIGAEGMPRLRGRRVGSAARNAIIPGWGSIAAGRGAAGWSDLASAVTTGYTLAREHDQYRKTETRLDNLLEALEATDDAQERQEIRARAWSVSRELNVQNSHRRRVLAFASYIYAFQLIDPWLLGAPPAADIEAGGTVVRFEGANTSRTKAMVLSLLKPGRGQLYQGKQGRSVFISLLTTAAGLFALDKHNAYDSAVNLYEMNIERFDAAQTISEKEYYRDRAPALWDDVTGTRRDRNMGYGVLAAVWMTGIIDTFFPGSEDTPALDVAFDIGPNRALLVYRF